MVGRSDFEERELREEVCDFLPFDNVEIIDGMDEKTVPTEDRSEGASGGRKRRSPVLSDPLEASSFSDSGVLLSASSALAGFVGDFAAVEVELCPPRMLRRLEKAPVRIYALMFGRDWDISNRCQRHSEQVVAGDQRTRAEDCLEPIAGLKLV
jgi:hypothetical protein